MDRELEQILSDDYLSNIEASNVAELRSMRDECSQVEAALSYLRRLAQGRLDIVNVELGRRRAGGDPNDLQELIDKLPMVLSDRTRGPGNGHLPMSFSPGQFEGELFEELAGIQVEAHLSNMPEASDAWLGASRESLHVFESKVSALRRMLFGRIDALQDELGRRYRSGEVTVESLIAGK